MVKKISEINIEIDLFLIIWSLLDALFWFIENIFISIFNAIPYVAIQFLIAIFCYSVVAIMEYFINREEIGTQKLLYKVFYAVFGVFMFLWVFWRFGNIIKLDQLADAPISMQIEVFIVNIVYMIFGMVVFMMFLKKITWLKKAVLVITWSLFLLLTFIICPAFTDFTLTDSTLIQVLIVASLFIAPISVNKIKDAKEGEGDDGD